MTDTTTQAVTALQIADLLGGLTVTGYRSTWTCDLPALMVQEVIAHAETQLRNLTAERDALAAQLAASRETLRMFKAWDFPGDLQDMAVRLEAAELRAREASLDALAAYGQAADAHAAQLAAEAERDSWRAQHDYLQIESAKCFDAQSEIDEAWDAIGTAGNKQILTLPEQISALCRDYDARAEAAEQRLATARAEALEEAARVCDGFNGMAHAAHDMAIGIFPKQSDLRDAVAAAIRALAKGGAT